MSVVNSGFPQIKFNFFKKLEKSFSKFNKGKNNIAYLFFSLTALALFIGFCAGILGSFYFYYYSGQYLTRYPDSNVLSVNNQYSSSVSYEQKIIQAIKKTAPAVVSIIILKDVPIFEQYMEIYREIDPFFGPLPFEFKIPRKRLKGTEKKEVGGGTGVIVSPDGIILTNKHVVSFEDAEYAVYTSDGKKYIAKVLAKDPAQDLAILKIEKKEDQPNGFPFAQLGDSDNIQLGQTVIAIGNALSEFRNTISVGVVSGLGRRIVASGEGMEEVLEDVIQTDAAINKGNSGGPLLNLKGEVIGINTAMVEQAQSIGFAIPINRAKRDIEQIKTIGKISYPFLGVQYVLIDEEIKKEYDLSVDEGALLVSSETGPAIVKNSAAEKAGLKEGDVIIEVNGEKIAENNSLAKVIGKYNPGDKVVIKYIREGKEYTTEAVLDERKE